MKRTVCFVVVFLVSVLGLMAQTGLALHYQSDQHGLFANHNTYPSGTKLLVTHPTYNVQIEVEVAGKPNSAKADIELSHVVCDYLGIEPGKLTRVKIEEAPAPDPKRQNLRQMKVMQTGIVTAHHSGIEYVVFHPYIPLDTKLTLTNTVNGQKVTATVKGRTPGTREHIMVISHAAAQSLGIVNTGEVYLETN